MTKPISIDDRIDEILTKLENAVARDITKRITQHSSGRSPKSCHAEAKQAIALEIRAAMESVEYWRPYDALYDVSTLGRVRRDGRILKPSNRVGYRAVALSHNGVRKSYSVHRLIAATFLPNPQNKRCINHKDGNRANNAVTNLEWVTHSENELHAYKVLGKINPSAKLTTTQMKDILERIGRKETNASIARLYGLSPPFISQIKHGVRYKALQQGNTHE